MHHVGGMAAPVAAFATLLFCAYLALYPALAGYAFARLKSGMIWRDVLLIAGVWILSEWLRGRVLTGFPWLALGYAQAPPSPLAGYAPLLGVYGVGLVSVSLIALVVFAWRRIATGIIIVAVLAGGYCLQRIEWTQAVGVPLTVSLLQGNIEQTMKWEPHRRAQSLDTYARLATTHPAQLVVLPETALPMFLDEVPRSYLYRLAGQGAALVGVSMSVREGEGAGGYVNAAVAIVPGVGEERPQSYAKEHLVPFGEFVPIGFDWFMKLIRMPMGSFTAGSKIQPPLDIAGQKIAPNICYEDLFGEEIIRALPQATLLVNLSNTAWFGDSLAQPQHLQIAQMRALETGRTMLRATNTGMTAVVHPDGRVAAALPAFATAALQAQVQGYGGQTPFVSWGNSLALLLALAALVPAIARWHSEE